MFIRSAVTALVLVAGVLVASPAAAASDTVLVKGHVTDTSGRPLAGVSVRAEGSSFAEEPEVEYQGEDVTSKTGYFSIRANAYAYLTVVSNTSKWLSVNERFVEITDQKKIVIDVTMAKPAAITGRVTDAAGKPIKNTTVFTILPSGAFGPTGMSNSKGAYAIKGLRPGDYTVNFSRSGYLESELPVRLTEAQKLTGTSVQLVKTTKITGSVTVNGTLANSDLGRVTATLINASGKRVQTDKVSSGDFAFSRLTPGDFTLEVCVYDECKLWVNPATGSPTISVATGESLKITAAVTYKQASNASMIYVEVKPGTVKWGKKVKVVASVSSYGNVAAGKLSLQHHGKVVKERKVGSDGTVTFVVSSKEWKNKKGTNRVKVKVEFIPTDSVRYSKSYATFTIK